jgi:hypothetical protein
MTHWRPRLLPKTSYPITYPVPKDLELPLRVDIRRVPNPAFFNICPVWKSAPFKLGVHEMILHRPHQAWWVRPARATEATAIVFRFDGPDSAFDHLLLADEPVFEASLAEDRSLVVWADNLRVIRQASRELALAHVATRIVWDGIASIDPAAAERWTDYAVLPGRPLTPAA